MIITRTPLSRRTVLKGMGVTVALPLLEAMVPARDGVGARRAGGPPTAGRHRDGARVGRRHRVRHGEASVVAGAGRIRVRSRPQRAQPARAVSTAPDHRQQHRRAQCRGVHAARDRRRSLPLRGGVPDPGASAPDAGLRSARRHLARPAGGAAVRAGHADPVDAAVHRERRPGRRLLLRLFVRLHRLDQLGVAERAVADDSRPAAGVRSAVRRRRHRRPASRPAAQGSQHPRLGGRIGRAPEQHAGRRRPIPARRVPGGRPRGRTAHPESGGVQPERRRARAAGRAGRGARLVRRARQADVRPAGDRLRVRRHARIGLQDEPRRVEPRLPRSRA